MSEPELLEEFVKLGMSGDAILRDIARHLAADNVTFALGRIRQLAA